MAAPAVSAAAVGQAVAAIGLVVDALAAIPGRVRDFVDAFNPNAGRQLDFAFRSLEATIGYALEPVIESFTSLFRTLASEFNDGLTGLRDVIEGLADVGGKVLQPIIRLLAVTFEQLVGMFKSGGGIFEVVFTTIEGHVLLLSTALQVVTTLVRGLIDAGLELLSGLLGYADVAKTLGEVFVFLTVAVVKFTDKVLRFLGLFGVADKVLESFTRRPGPGRPEGISGQKVTDLTDIYRARLAEAAKGYGGPAEKEKSLFDAAAEQIRLYKEGLDIADAQKTVLEQIRDRIRDQPNVRGAREQINKYLPPNAMRAGGLRSLGPLGILADWIL